MDEIEKALRRDRTIDITTIGRKTGKSRRIEIWFYRVDGRIYLSGSPGRRDWYANLLAENHFVFHLKRSTRADIPAIATPVAGEAQRRRILPPIVKAYASLSELDRWVASSPLVEVSFPDLGPLHKS